MIQAIVLVFLCTLLLTRLGRPGLHRAAERLVAHRSLLLVVGGLTAARVMQAWGGWNVVPLYHDEQAYVLQSNIFAGFRWSAPSPPVLEAFEQPHVLVEPRYAAKYFPGHSLALAPFALFGLPALGIILLSAASGVLLVLIVRRIAGASVALLTWALWLSSPQQLTWRASYFSQTTSAFCVLLTAFALLRWHDTKNSRWLHAAAAALGWCAITRPLTAVVVAVPVAVFVLWKCHAFGTYRSLAGAIAVGSAVIALLPLWAWRTTGNALKSPYGVWTEQYLPFDVIGFAGAAAEPTRGLPAELRGFSEEFRMQKASYTSDQYWSAVVARGNRVVHSSVMRDVAPFIPLALLGLAIGGVFAWIATATFALHLALHGFYYHSTAWSIYYLEYFPVVPLLVALGAGWVFKRCATVGLPAASAPRFQDAAATFVVVATLGIWILAVPPQRSENTWLRRATEFRDDVAALTDSGKIVFVRPDPNGNGHFVLISNERPYDRSPTWIVRELDDDRNAAVRRAAPQRESWLYDEATKRFSRLPGLSR